MVKIILDGKEFDTIEELHAILKRKLELPDYYGNNLDALWDCLNSCIDLPLAIEWVHFNESEKKLGEYAKKVVQIFRYAEKGIQGFVLILR